MPPGWTSRRLAARPGPALDGAIRRRGAPPLRDQFAELGLGVGAGLGVLVGQLLGLGLGVGERRGELLGLLALAVERLALVFDVGHQRIEFVGGHVTGAQRDLGEFVTLDRVVQVVGVLEQRAERRGTAADERPQRHLAEVAAQLGELGFLLGDTSFGVGDLDVELGLGVDRFDVLLAELERCSSSRSSSSTMSSTFCRCWSTLCACTTAGAIAGTSSDREGDRDADRSSSKKLPHSNERSLANMTNVLRKADENSVPASHP